MTRSGDGFADVRVTLWGVLLLAMLMCWISYESNARLKMARTHAHFAEAVRIARHDASGSHEDVSGNTSASTGPDSTANHANATFRPRNTGEWISLYNSAIHEAPDGGPAFIVNVQGNPATGAIGISATNYGTELHITRPAYRSLKSHKIVVKPLHIALHQS